MWEWNEQFPLSQSLDPPQQKHILALLVLQPEADLRIHTKPRELLRVEISLILPQYQAFPQNKTLQMKAKPEEEGETGTHI